MSNEVRERVIKESLIMFIEQGVRDVRMDDIARRMRISKRTLYEIFGDKEGLLYEAMITHMDDLSERMDRVGYDAPNILVSILKVSEYLTANANQTRRLSESVREYYPRIDKRVRETLSIYRHEIFKERLHTGIEQGLIKESTDLGFFIYMLYHISTAISCDAEMPSGEEIRDKRKMFFTAMATLLRGVSTHKGIEVIDGYLDEIKNNQ